MRRGERGAGLFAMAAGLAVVLALLALAAQMLVYLHATSVVTAVAHDTAALASTGTPVREAEAHARSLLGAAGREARFEWDVDDPDVVRVRVVAGAPRVFVFGDDTIDRAVTVRVERARDD